MARETRMNCMNDNDAVRTTHSHHLLLFDVQKEAGNTTIHLLIWMDGPLIIEEYNQEAIAIAITSLICYEESQN